MNLLLIALYFIVSTWTNLEAKPKVCVAITVDNELALTIRTLNSIKKIADYACICDFTDDAEARNFLEIFMKNNQIEGKIYKLHAHSPKEARNLTLKRAQETLSEEGFPLSESYLLTLEGGSVLQVSEGFQKEELQEEAYLLYAYLPSFSYFNSNLLKASLSWEDRGIFSYEWRLTHSDQIIDTKLHTLSIETEKEYDLTRLTQKIQLLLETIDKGEEAIHNLFLLANLYYAIGDYQTAALWFEKRINLWGDEEECWFSSYKLGLCYEALNAWDRALFWFLDAFQKNPQRPEPLYRLANQYRRNNQYDLAHLFAAYGLKIPAAHREIFFDSPLLQPYHLAEEVSVAAYYTPFRSEGFDYADNLTLQRNTPWYLKYQSQQNSLFYVQPLPHTRLHPIQIDLPRIVEHSQDRYMPCNPSILTTEAGYQLLLRAVNFTIESASRYHTIDPDRLFRTKNFLLEYDKAFNILSAQEIDCSIEREAKRKSQIRGLEDCRIFSLHQELWFTCTTFDTSPHAIQISACKVNATPSEAPPHVVQLTPLQGPDPFRDEKNWLPFVIKDSLYTVYSYDPFVILKPDLTSGHCKKIFEYTPQYDFSRFRGSAGPVAFNEGYLILVHTVDFRADHSRVYLHRLLYLDSHFRIQKLSKPFYFAHLGVEFCCSMTIDHDKKNLIIPIGVQDKEAYLCSISLDEVEALLEPLPIINHIRPY